MAERAPLPARALLLVPGGLALLAGLDAALLLLGLPAPVTSARLPQVHGMLLVLGFVGTVVALERAVALGRLWGYAAPAGLGLGAIALLTPLPLLAGGTLFIVGSVVLILVYVPLWRRQPADAVLVQAGGAVLATGAAGLWAAGVDVPHLLPWLTGFLVLTIVGERLELAHVVVLGPRAGPTLVALSAAVMAAAAGALLWPVVGYPVLGAAILGLIGWLARYDVARRTIRARGLARFMAAALLTGYAWLAVTGAVWLLAGEQSEGFGYDLVVHSVFLGFVISMIMAHAPVILPAVLRRPLPYRPVMYVPAVLLSASLLLRTAVGDVRGVTWAWQWGGVLNIVALLLFVGIAAWSVLTGAPRAVPRPPRTPSPPPAPGPGADPHPGPTLTELPLSAP